MSQIKILPEILSNKIAAGEVVERPASVVKELVENALDAGSARIIIEVEKGGQSLIRVADNGTGMRQDDALLALERYATSKIYKDQDLFNIHTLGFRGEALPSIAAVSKFTLVTRDKRSATGTEIQVEGGKIRKVLEVGAPPGTMITVKRLFYNTPARRKFLKTTNTEMGHVADTVSNMALARPGVQFKLLHNSKPTKDWPAVTDPKDRVVDYFGRESSTHLHPIAYKAAGLTIDGWILSPRFTRRTSRGIHVYVNGRFVRDKMIQHALFEGYTQRLVKGQYPLAVLFITVPFDRVDVNVHPTKSEVRFAEHRKVHDTVQWIVAETLSRTDQPQWAEGYRTEYRQIVKTPRISESKVQGSKPGVQPATSSAESGSGFSLRRAQPSRVQDLQNEAQGSGLKAERRVKDQEPGTLNFESGTQTGQTALWQKRRFGDLRVLGQIHSTYILCEADTGLILIDQHAAHERVLYEQLKCKSKCLAGAAQKLLVPETLELGYREAGIVEKLIEDFYQLGLEVEPFGGNTFVVKSVPALLSGREIAPLIMEIVEKLAAIGFSRGLGESLDACLQIMACHGAIRAKQALSREQIKGLLAQMDQCDNPSHCVHGRPTWIQWTLGSLEKSFKRRV
jgi:DNA mismatch repair protein MutL